MIAALALAAAYLIGAVPFGYILVRLKTGGDVRSQGSGNIGATNVLRTTGRGMALAVLLLDMVKGYAAVWLVSLVTHGSILWSSAAALAVMAGHAFPVFLRFRGGKAVASFIGAFTYLAPLPLIAVLLVFLVIVSVTRFVSLGSVMAAGTFPLAVWLILHPPWPVLAASLAAGGFIVYRHRGNLARIRAGNEHLLSLGSKKL